MSRPRSTLPQLSPSGLEPVALAALVPALLLLLLLLLAVLACRAPQSSGTARLRVLAAASLTDAVTELTRAYSESSGTIIDASFGSSSALARQIRGGAPADVFISASSEWIDDLESAGLVVGEPKVIASNSLVVIAPASSGLTATDPASLLEELPQRAVVAIADRGVPAGEYARAALGSAGLESAYEPRLVGLSDVRAVLRTVELGQAEAGFVYATDAATSPVKILFSFSSASHPPIDCVAVVVRQNDTSDSLGSASTNAAARAQQFVEFLTGPIAHDALRQLGFQAPRSQAPELQMLDAL